MKITYDTVPEAIEALLNEVMELKQLVTKSVNSDKPREMGVTMDVQSLIEFMTSQGLRMSKSKLYKLVSAKKIPYSKFNGCLVFSYNEIQEWIDGQMVSSSKPYDESVSAIARSAQSQERRNK